MAATPWDVWAASEALSGHMEPPPFWAHTWPGSIALARYLLDGGAQLGARTVLDFGGGCGLAAIAAARLGARALAVDVDETAVVATALNARLNGVAVEARAEDLVGQDGGWDVVLAGDVFYSRWLAENAGPWLRQLARRGATVLLGDPGRSFLPWQDVERLATYDVAPVPEWDSVLDRLPGVYRLGPGAS